MKRLLLLLLCVLSVFVLIGCDSFTGNKSSVDVIIDGNGQFPEFLAGKWIANDRGWQFVFEPDGRISSAIHTIGWVEVKPGQVTRVSTKQGGKGIFESGRWTVQYSSVDRELMVEVILKHFRAQNGNQALEGTSKDVFIGPVSEDGQQWTAEWFAFPEYVAFTDIYDNYKLPVDYNDNPRGTLVFKKIKGAE